MHKPATCPNGCSTVVKQRYRSKQVEGKRHRPLQRSPAASRTPLHPARSEERQHHNGISRLRTNSGIQLHQRPCRTTDYRLPHRYRTLYLRNRIRHTEASLYPAAVHHGRSTGEAAHQGQPLLPSPFGAEKGRFPEQVFTPQNGIAALCGYLTELLREVAVLYRQEKAIEDIFNQLYRESLFKSYTLINRLLSLIENDGLSLHTDTLKRLMNRLLTATNIPFHGEPAIGMQVMGVLETRNLDFRNLIMLSLNEGQLPKAGGDSSFIPYNLRKAFGMTTIEHKNAVYAYYFYRLIQRAENITLLYNTSSDGLNRGRCPASCYNSW